MAESRLKTALHYIIYKAQLEGKLLGSVRLNKILFCADAAAFDQTFKFITNATYIKRPCGPMIKDFQLFIDELKAANFITETFQETYTHDIRAYTSLFTPDMTAFSPEEIQLLDKFTQEICDEPAEDAIIKTHNNIWKIGEMDEPLPVAGYFTSEILPVTDVDFSEMSKLLASHSK